MKKLGFGALIAIFAFVCLPVTAQEHPRTPRKYNFVLSDFAKRITPMVGFNRNMHGNGWIWKEGRSSALVEKGKPADFYEITKLSDNNEEGSRDASTAWVEGVDGDGIGEWVIIPVEPLGDLASKMMNGEVGEKLKIELSVYNGYQKSIDLYYKNNRVKEAEISIYAASIGFGQDDAYLLSNPEVISTQTFKMSDDTIENPFYLNWTGFEYWVDIPEKYRNDMLELYLKFKIKSVYKGTKYNDTCIANIDAVASED